jgi:hypothetical protein
MCKLNSRLHNHIQIIIAHNPRSLFLRTYLHKKNGKRTDEGCRTGGKAKASIGKKWEKDLL